VRVRGVREADGVAATAIAVLSGVAEIHGT